MRIQVALSFWLVFVLAWLAVGAAPVALVDAVQQGDLRTAGPLRRGADVDAPSADVTTPLYAAVLNDDVVMATRLLDAGADVTRPTRLGVTPLMAASVNGDAALIQRLVDAGANPNTATSKGETVLMMAARTGKTDAIDVLLRHGARVNDKETWLGQTGLMWAASEGHVATVETLIQAGADVHVRSRGGNTAFLYAVRAGHVDVLSALLAAGEDINVCGVVTGEMAANRSNGEIGQDGSSALAVAVLNARFDVALWLLDHGADPNVADPRGSVLHTIAWLRRPGHHRRRDEGAFNPLPTGEVDSLDLAKALLRRGADPNRRVNWEESKVSVTRAPSNLYTGRNYLTLNGATPYFLAAKHQDVDYMHLLIANGASASIPTIQGVTPFAAAAGVGFWPGESPGVNTGVTEKEALEALTLAWEVNEGDINQATYAEELPEPPDGIYHLNHPNDYAPDRRWAKSTALHGAVLRESPNALIQFLVDKGARLDATTTLGWTPFSLAAGASVGNTFRTASKETLDLLKHLMKEQGIDPAASIVCEVCGAARKAQ
jgi:ankyrin repeat protein